MYKRVFGVLSVLLCLSSPAIANADATGVNNEFSKRLGLLNIPSEYALEDVVIGSKDAPVVLIIYSSFTCEFCRKFFLEVWPILKKQLIDTGKVQVHLRSYADDLGALESAAFVNCLKPLINVAGRVAFALSLYKKQPKWKKSDDPPKYLRKRLSKYLMKTLKYSLKQANKELAKCESDMIVANAGVMLQLKDAYARYGIKSIPAFVVMSKETFSKESKTKVDELFQRIKIHEGRISYDKLEKLCLEFGLNQN